MWFLENEGDLFEHKRIWLQPGTKHLLGRTRDHRDGEMNTWRLDAKSVSRKHLLIEITQAPTNSAKSNSRSLVTITEESKFGTTLDDGEPFTHASRTLTGDNHTIKLGKYEHKFKYYYGCSTWKSADIDRISWHPVVLSFNLVGKKKSLDDPLATFRTRLAPFDIKTTTAYEHKTSHVVADKRNTPMGLQALVNGKHIVTEAFVEAIIRAGTAGRGVNDGDGPELSLLQEDFDKHWPSAITYLPPAGKEPVPRSAQMFLPNAAREDVFAGYTFIFCDEAQFSTLQAPIQNGHGKALYYKLKPGETTPDEFVRYVKSVAGEKGLGEFEDGSEGKGVVCLRSKGIKGWEQWTVELQRNVQLQLDQRDVEQNEFLDAIIMNDASVLRRKLPEDIEPPTSQAPQVLQSQSSLPKAPEVTPTATQNETQQTTTRRKPRRVITQSRFKGFDSDDEPPKITIAHDDDDEDMDDVVESQVSLANDATPNTQSAQSQRANLPSRKRIHDESDVEDNLDDLLPAAAAIKRRKIQEGTYRAKETPATESQPVKKSRAAEMEKLRKAVKSKDKEIDVKEAIRERREAQEKAEQRQAEEDGEPYDADEVKALRDLAIIEEMEIKPRDARPNRTETHGDRWDDRWNGRRNFKKFRKQGSGQPALRGPRVVVTLEETKKKDFSGADDGFWLGSNNQASSARRTQDDSDSDVIESTGFVSHRAAASWRPTASARSIQTPDERESEQPSAQSRGSRVRIGETPASAESESVRDESVPPPASARGKRAAAASPVTARPAKRREVVPDEDEGTSTGFKFKRGGKRGKA